MKKKTIKFTNKKSGETKEIDSTLLGSHVFNINKSVYEMNDAVRWCNNHDAGDEFDCDDYAIEIISIP